jgi:RNA polymerase sigma factor (sigma-70 family)
VITQPTAESNLDRLAREHAAAVFRYLLTVVGDRDLAQDLVQDTFVRLHRHARDAGPGLVFTTARSVALDHLRRRKIRRRHEHHDQDTALDRAAAADQPAPDRSLEDQEFRRDLARALARLPEEQRTVFHLTEIEGRPYDEVARVLGISPGTIASRKHHAVRKLREHLRRLGYDA